MIGLGTAWSYDAIFKPESKHLPKDAVEAKRRERALEENMYNDLAHVCGGEGIASLQVAGPGAASPDLVASQLLC